MLTEDYVSFEIAKLLKEKGFDIPCKVWYAQYTSKWGGDPSGDRTYNVIQFDDHNKFEDGYRFLFYAPTLQMAIKWLREIHNIHISVYPFNRELPITENTSYTCDVATKKDSPMRGHLRGTWKTYEAAADDAIKYALEHELP